MRQQEDIVAGSLDPRETQRSAAAQPPRERLPVLQPNRFLVDQRNEELQIRYHSWARYSYELRALLKNGRQVTLVGNLVEPEEAAYLEQQIEGRLGIKDRPIAGEYLV